MSIQRIQNCGNCKYMDPRAEVKLCRRSPPTYGPVVVPVKQGVMAVQMHGGWPQVKLEDWCGEHVPMLAIVNQSMPVKFDKFAA